MTIQLSVYLLQHTLLMKEKTTLLEIAIQPKLFSNSIVVVKWLLALCSIGISPFQI